MAEKLVLSLIKRECITITENSTISDLTNLLTLNDIGAVVVVNSNNKAIGIVSERDVIKNYNTNHTHIKNIMTKT